MQFFYRKQIYRQLQISFNLILLIEFDECTANVHSCSINAECIDTVQSFKCICNPGFTGNGKYCDGKFILNSILRQPKDGN